MTVSTGLRLHVEVVGDRKSVCNLEVVRHNWRSDLFTFLSNPAISSKFCVLWFRLSPSRLEFSKNPIERMVFFGDEYDVFDIFTLLEMN